MSRSFSYDLSLSESPADAQARLRQVVSDELRRSANMRLASEESHSLAFRPQWSWPLLAALFRVISREAVNLNFSAANGGTRVAVSGKVAGSAEKIANRDFWAQTLSAA